MQEVIGIMLDFNPREYSIRELYDSYRRKETILSPKFQRRPVWEYKAKSYLIDSILSGFPIRLISCKTGKNVDGFAQNLANKLGRKVIAPSDTVWIHPSGKMTIGPNARSNTGKWVSFGPKKVM